MSALSLPLTSGPLPSGLLHFGQMMEVLEENSELVFLFNLVKGQGDSSMACHIASTAGLPQEIVDRGAEVRRDSVQIHCPSNGNGDRQYTQCSLHAPSSAILGV